MQRTVESMGLTPEDRQAIQKLFDEHRSLVMAADWDALSTHYAEDVVVMLPNQPDIIGREQWKKLQQTFPAISEYEIQIRDLDGCGDTAYLRGEFSMANLDTDGSRLIRDTGRWLWVLQRKSSGVWEVVRDIYNSTQPLP